MVEWLLPEYFHLAMYEFELDFPRVFFMGIVLVDVDKPDYLEFGHCSSRCFRMNTPELCEFFSGQSGIFIIKYLVKEAESLYRRSRQYNFCNKWDIFQAVP